MPKPTGVATFPPGENFGPPPGGYVNNPLAWKYDHYPDTYRTMQGTYGSPLVGPDEYDAPSLDEVNDARRDADDFSDRVAAARKPPADPPPHIGMVPPGALPVESSEGQPLSAKNSILAPEDDPDEDEWEDGGDLTSNSARLHLARLLAKSLALTAGYLQWQMWGVCVAHELLKAGQFGEHGGRKLKEN